MKKYLRKILFVLKWPFEFVWSVLVYVYYCRKMEYIDYFDYKLLANPKFIAPKSFNAVFIYANYKCVEKLTKRKFNFITDYVEHSTNFVTEPEMMRNFGYYNRPFIRNIYVMSELRASVYNKCIKRENLKSKAIVVGPHILGTDFFKSKAELDALKQKYGRILLVFPHHSIKLMTSNYDVEEFVNIIHKYKNNFKFDSVFISMFWSDILRNREEIYKKNGFVIVSSGHGNDPNFLRRQKDLIYLADYTMSNHIGAYIGYSICMGKPHFLYNQSTHYSDNRGKIEQHPSSFNDAKIKFAQVFDTFTETITPEQRQLVELYWGKWDDAKY